MRRLVIGDIHGRYNALIEVLKASKFDYDKDKLIILGDVVDGGFNAYLVIEELLKIHNKIIIIGNHDEWFMNHIKSGWAKEIWLSQGGAYTVNSYKDRLIPVTHQEFFNVGKYYHIEDNMLFVHGGFYPEAGIEKTPKEVLLWDRNIIIYAKEKPIPGYKKVFIGHSTTQHYGFDIPIRFNNLYLMDCGAGWNGRLAIKDIDTDEHWVSQIQDPNVTKIKDIPILFKEKKRVPGENMCSGLGQKNDTQIE